MIDFLVEFSVGAEVIALERSRYSGADEALSSALGGTYCDGLADDVTKHKNYEAHRSALRKLLLHLCYAPECVRSLRGVSTLDNVVRY